MFLEGLLSEAMLAMWRFSTTTFMQIARMASISRTSGSIFLLALGQVRNHRICVISLGRIFLQIVPQ